MRHNHIPSEWERQQTARVHTSAGDGPVEAEQDGRRAHMKVVEKMRRPLREGRDINKLDSN